MMFTGSNNPHNHSKALQLLLRNYGCQDDAEVSPGFGMQWLALNPFFELTELLVGAACYFPRGTSYQGNLGANQH
jgi:hypothetical protein